ncbi:MAG: prepilin-type N-terminal cleavage/methylation domain-containing protein [Gammaproteobacteria bacterium]|nr:prepilin-type N-terminal cleavage/methylation domain-containing protein [Gammaproteobacteria bacterium]
MLSQLQFIKHSNNKGFSLIELMIAISISLVLLLGLVQIFISSKRSYNIQDSIARMQENGRYAVELLSGDIRLAGYMGGNADVTTIGGSTPPELPDGSCVSDSDRQWGRMIARGIFGINDGLTGYNCIEAAGGTPEFGQYLSGDILTVRYAKPVALKATDSVNNLGYYIKSSPMVGQIEIIDNKTRPIDSFFNTTAAASVAFNITDTPVTYNKLVARSYYSGFQQSDCNGNTFTVPTLYRLALGTNGTPQQQEIIRGIENLQLQYGEDVNNDGSPDQYLDADDITNWTAIKAVRLWLLVRDECPSAGYNNTNTYQMGDANGDANFEANDNFRRHLYTSTIMLRNNETI